MAPRRKLTVLLLYWFIVLVLVCLQVRTQQVSFVNQPQNKAILEGNTGIFSCEISSPAPAEAIIKWYTTAGEQGSRAIRSDGDRFEISEVPGKVAENLIITDSRQSDSGYYFCTYGNESKSMLGKLDVIPTTWLPQCSQTPSTGILSIGEHFELTCTSTGHVNTSLVWYVGQKTSSSSSPLNDAQVNVSKESSTVTTIYASTVDTSEAMVYTCEATLEGLPPQEGCTISINKPQINMYMYIPFIVVGLMSLIALLLFFVVLLILFRHRQCRLCQQAMQEPHTVLDARSLQTGSWVPPPVVAIDVEGSESSEDRVSEKDTSSDIQHTYFERGTTQPPPDVVPVLEPVDVPEIGDQPSSSSEVVPKPAPAAAVNDQLNEDESGSSELVPKTVTVSTTERKPKTKNLTLTKNMDKNIEKPEKIAEKKEVQFSAHRTRGTQRRDKKVKRVYKEPPVKAKMKSPHKEPIYAHVKKLNVPPKSAQGETEEAPSTSTGAKTVAPPEPPPRPSPDTDSKDTSSTATADTNSLDQTPVVNDLGRGNSKKKRVKHYRKKSEDIKRNAHAEDVVLNIPASTSTASPASSQPKSSPKVPADRVIYAELDFSKNVGLNII